MVRPPGEVFVRPLAHDEARRLKRRAKRPSTPRRVVSKREVRRDAAQPLGEDSTRRPIDPHWRGALAEIKPHPSRAGRKKDCLSGGRQAA